MTFTVNRPPFRGGKHQQTPAPKGSRCGIYRNLTTKITDILPIIILPFFHIKMHNSFFSVT